MAFNSYCGSIASLCNIDPHMKFSFSSLNPCTYGTANLLVVLPRNKKDHAMRYPCAQALLHSRIPNDWYRGMDLVQWKMHVVMFLSLALRIKPNCQKSLSLKEVIAYRYKQDEVYVVQPEGYEKKDQSGKVYKLNKALYGLRQAPRAWNSRLDRCLKQLGFKRCQQEYTVYTRNKDGKILIVGVYVDDLIVTGSCSDEIRYFKEQMNKEFKMSDMGLLSYYLGIEVSQYEDRITLKQAAYVKTILKKTGMEDCNACTYPMEPKLELTKDEAGDPVDPTEFRSIVRALRYLTHTRLDISYAVGLVSRFMEKPTAQHLKAVKHILRYVKGTVNYGIVYTKGSGEDIIIGYTDSDFARDVNDRRSTRGMVFYLNNNLVIWGSQKQLCVALSSCEAEFMAATTATCQAIWIKRLLSEITGREIKPPVLFIDNKSALDLAKNPVFHGRSKHIDTKFHFIRECVEKGGYNPFPSEHFCCLLPSTLLRCAELLNIHSDCGIRWIILVQRASESRKVVDMKQMKMDWVPYVPLGKRSGLVERLKSQIFVLSCVQRRAGLKRLKDERVAEFNYCVPFIELSALIYIIALLQHLPLSPATFPRFPGRHVAGDTYPGRHVARDNLKGKARQGFFLGRLSRATWNIPITLLLQELSEDQKDAFKEFLKENVQERKRAIREARQKRKQALEELSQEKLDAINNTVMPKVVEATGKILIGVVCV
ncbi:zinc finger, CCHC-type containing protein [Tanacetum coccineum]|uniref:Zinc finger, CCHC-type containing protein n=1 Tax=Tanacetum coccineum TaxID=301880 RepID=A0ABQ5E8M4_9ASTR